LVVYSGSSAENVT